jgi:hypothetical protein
MRKDAVASVLFLIVVVLTTMLANGNIHAETDTLDKNQDWESRSLDDIHAVRGIIYDWIKAWQSKDLVSYMSYYSPEFHSEKLDYQGWRRKKATLFKRPGLIFVEISNLLVFIEEKEAKVSFIQEYTDARLSDVGEKSIRLRYSHGTWKIVSEKWQPIKR